MRPWTLLGIAAAVGVVLWTLFPGIDQGGRDDAFGPDSVSLAYLRNEVRSRPFDLKTRVKLAELELAVDHFAEADAALAPLVSDLGEVGRKARRLRLDLSLKRMNAVPVGDKTRRDLVRQTLTDLDALVASDLRSLSLDDIRRLAELKLSLGRPREAASLYEKLADRDPAGASQWLLEAARWYQAANRLADAATAYARLAERDRASGDKWFVESARRFDAARNVDKAVEMYLAASEATKSSEREQKHALKALAIRRAQGPAGQQAAVALAAELVKRFPNETGILAPATKTAIGASDLGRARVWGQKQIALGEAAPQTIEQQLDVLLGSGDLAGAVALLQRMVSEKPEDKFLRRKLATVAVWGDQPEVALEVWGAMAMEGDPEARDKSLELARSIFDGPRSIVMLKLKARDEGLTFAEFRELVDTTEDQGDPAAAVAVMKEYGTPFQIERDWWTRLAGLQERQGDLRGALATSEGMTRQFGPRLEDVQAQTEMLWRLDLKESAFARIRSGDQLATDKDTDFWRLYGELAWSLGRAEDAARAYRVLWKTPAKAGVEVADRLMALAGDAGRVDELISVGRDSLGRFGNAHHLMWALDSAHAAERRSEVKSLLAAAATREPEFRTMTAYWAIKGYAARGEGENAGAQRAFEQVLALDPGSLEARVELLWLAVERGDTKEIQKRIAACTSDDRANPRFWEVLEAGHERLGQQNEANVYRSKKREVLLASLPAEARKAPADRRVGLDGKLLPVSLRLSMALSEEDRQAVRAILDREGEQLTLAERVDAERWLGREQTAFALLLNQDAGARGVPPTPEEAIDLAAAREELGTERFSAVSAQAGFTRLGTFDVLEEKAGAMLRFGTTGLLLGPEAAARQTSFVGFAQDGREYYAGAAGELRRDASRTSISAGAHMFAEGTMPAARIIQTYQPMPGTEVYVGGTWNELPTSTGELRSVGLERGVRAGTLWELTPRDRISFDVVMSRLASRGGDLLAWGATLNGQVEHEFRIGDALVIVRGDTEAQGNDLAPGELPPDVLTVLAPGGTITDMSDIMPTRYATAGVGVTLTNNIDAAGAAKRLRFFADAWSGWLFPANRPTYSLEAGLAVKLRQRQELNGTGFFYTDRGGILEQRYHGVALNYAIRWH